MDIEQFSRRMIELMPKCIRGFQGYESNYLSRGQISQPQFWALEYLSRKGSSLMSELASFLNISRPAATGLIDRLIAQKLVNRRMDEQDRRTVHVDITPKGKKIVAGIWEQKRRGMAKAFSQVSPAERKQYLDILEKVVHNLASKTVCCLTAAMLVLGAFLPCAGAQEAALTGLTLKQAYGLALERSETVAIQAQVIREAEGHFYQSLSSFLPSVDFVDTERHQGKGSRSSDAPGLRYIPQRAFTFTQPLFSGFKEFAGIAASKAEKKERRQQLIRAKELLFTDVSDAFYLLQSYQKDLEALAGIDQALQDYGAELKRRAGLGRSKSSEVASALSKLYQNEATMASVKSQMENARQLMEFLTGRPVGSLANGDVLIGDVGAKEDYVKKADSRADVQAAQAAAQVALKQVSIARAGYFPNVDLVANRYIKRVGASSGVDWDATLNITVPVFDGGDTYGQVKTAKALAEEARLQWSQAKRQAVLDIENAYTRLTEDRSQIDAYKKAVDAAQENYNDQLADYKNSLVNNLDVLQAVQDLQSTRRSYIVVESDAQRAYWALKVATGDIADDII